MPPSQRSSAPSPRDRRGLCKIPIIGGDLVVHVPLQMGRPGSFRGLRTHETAASPVGGRREDDPRSARCFENLTVDLARREVTSGDLPCDLTALEFDLLSALASAPGRVFTRRQLVERVWGWGFFGDERLVDVHIRNLGTALDDDVSDAQVIGTVRGVGCKLLADRR